MIGERDFQSSNGLLSTGHVRLTTGLHSIAKPAGWRRLAALLGLLFIAVALGPLAPYARAAANQESMIEVDPSLRADPAGTFAKLRLLGVQRVRVDVWWAAIAPKPNALHPPRGFNGADPASYPAANWANWDAIVRDAAADGIGLDFDVMGSAPRWALGPNRPRVSQNGNWEPSATMYGAFVHALAERYSGQYDPAARQISLGGALDLPRVSFWSVWNEPDYGPSLAPQGVPGHLTIENSPRMYRGLVDAAWTALHQTGHGSDTFLFGELAPRGMNRWGVFSGIKPIVFLRALYCVDRRYREYRGVAARLRGCPTTAAGSSRFRAQNPALFQATGVSDHPYMRWYPPNREQHPDPDYSTLGEIGNLERAVDRLQRVYGSHAHLPVWDTEFGYITDPPKHHNQYPWVSPSTAAYYLNWAEYISWRDPRVQSFDQYLLADAQPANKADDWGGYASGLISFGGHRKVTYSAWRLPLYLPHTTTSSGHSLEVWGCARPAPYALIDTGATQSVDIQFSPASGGPFQTVDTVDTGGSDGGCYFDTGVVFPGSGAVRLMWSYPAQDPLLGAFADGNTVYSRQVQITVH